MRVIPVIDLKAGVVVHARRGQRAQYAPLRSPLVPTSDPLTVAHTLCKLCRTKTLYVADLDAIAGAPPDQQTLAALAAQTEPWVDAGATTPQRAAALAKAGVARNIVGTESITTHDPAGAQGPQRVLSVDLREGKLISPLEELAGQRPAAAAPLATELNVRELIVIDLARVGTATGPPIAAVEELAKALPGLEIYAGGGVRDDADLRALQDAGAAGALVATALHEGRITP
jgi:phosphoribosylformimino-5-aminoimidazole carboxamide ribotide isomerase